jgi:hypothetical protein
MHDLGYAHARQRMPEIRNALEMKRELLAAL